MRAGRAVWVMGRDSEAERAEVARQGVAPLT